MREDDYRRFLVERERALRAEIARRCIYSPIGALVELGEDVAAGDEEDRLNLLEGSLRDILDETLRELEGERYWDRLVPPDIRTAVSARMAEQAALHPEAEKRRGVTHRMRLSYCDFSDYERIVLQRSTWPAFETIFQRKGKFERHITSARRFRNALKHMRDIEAVERLAGHAAILWLEKAIGQIRFSGRIVVEDHATVGDCMRVLTRRKVPEGQRQLLNALVQAGPSGLSGEELVEAMGRRDLADLGGVLGALGYRVNRTPGYGESKTPGIGMLLDVTQMDEGWQYGLKRVTLEALRQLAPSWLAGDDVVAAIGAHGTGDEEAPDSGAFREACGSRVEGALERELRKQSSVLFVSDEKDIAVVCLVSREYRSSSRVRYWFAFRRLQKERLEEAENGYLALGCGSPDDVLLVPIEDFAGFVSGMNQTASDDKNPYWHVVVHREEGQLVLRPRHGSTRINLSQYLI